MDKDERRKLFDEYVEHPMYIVAALIMFGMAYVIGYGLWFIGIGLFKLILSHV